MGKLFTLTDDIKNIARDAIDDLIDQLGKTCTLVYPPKWVDCANAATDPVGHKGANRWVNGGASQFNPLGVCSLCNGEGKIAQEVTDDVVMLLAWEPSKFFVKSPAYVDVPKGQIQTKGYITDLPKIMKARQMIVQPSLESTIRWRFELAGEPIDPGNIIQGRYFVALWNRSA